MESFVLQTLRFSSVVFFPSILLSVLSLIIGYFGLTLLMLPLLVTDRFGNVLPFLLDFDTMILGTAIDMLLVFFVPMRMLVFINFVMNLLMRSPNIYLVRHLVHSILLVFILN